MENVSSSNGLEKRPKLRFPGFDEPYKQCRIGDIYAERSQRGASDMELLSVTMNDGVKPRSAIEGKDNSSEDKSNYKIVRKGDMVYNSMRMWQGANGISPCDGIVSPAYTVLMPKQEINNGYFAALFKSVNLINEFRKNSQGMTSDTWNLKYPQIETIKVQIPSVSEQDKVSELFSVLDERIAAQSQLVESLKKYKRGLVFHIFRDNNPFGFEMKATPMKDLLHEYRNRDTVNLRVCSVAVNKGVVDQVEHLGRSFAAADTSNYGRVKPGDVVYTKSPTGCFPYGIVKQNWMDEEVAVSPLYGVYTPVSKDAGYLLHTYFEQSQNANNYIRTLAQKGAKNTINITTSHFLDKSILFPSNEDCVSHLAKMFDAISAELSLAEKELELLLRQRKTLLQQLFI
mgnify:CR=1 FL=1